MTAHKVGYLKKIKKNTKKKRTQNMTQKRVGLGEPETERLKNELQKNKKDSSNTCVTSAWEMTRFHQMPSWPLGPSVFPQEFQSRNGEDMASLMAFDPLILRDRWPLSIIIGG
jgi:hypothetical protein